MLEYNAPSRRLYGVYGTCFSLVDLFDFWRFDKYERNKSPSVSIIIRLNAE
jgi:hypothetical protein